MNWVYFFMNIFSNFYELTGFSLNDGDTGPVSYTHLDVYKRQLLALFKINIKQGLRNWKSNCKTTGTHLLDTV